MTEFYSRVARALELENVGYPFRLSVSGRKSAVLVLLSGDDPEVLITKRSSRLESHRGQYAFPGGVMEPHELATSDFEAAALREFTEELGPSVLPQVQWLGRLPSLTTPSGFEIMPTVARLEGSHERLGFQPSLDEVESYFWVKLENLRDPGVYRKEWVETAQVRYPTDVFQIGEHRVWGATGAMLKNLLDRLDLV